MAEHKIQSFGSPGGTIVNGPDIPPQVISAMKKRAQLGTGVGVNRLAQAPFNPLIQNLDIPVDYYVRNTYKRHFFKTNPTVGACLELHAEFPLSNFELEHEDPAIEEFLNDMLVEANFFEVLIMASVEWWLIGEFNLLSFFDDIENPSCYTGFALLDPNKLIIASSNFIQGPYKEVVQLSFDDFFRKVVEGGANHPVTGQIFKYLPSDMVSYCKARLPMPLSPLQVTRMKKGGNLNLRGESILERVFPLLMLKDELRSLQRAVARRAINPIELWKIGETNDPADNDEIEAFREILQATYYDINTALVYHHAVNCQIIGTEGRMPVLWPEFEQIDNEICAGLLMNKGLILGDASTFASDVVRLDILIQRYLMYRTKLERWLLHDLIAPILKIHEMYVPESKVKSMQYREMCGKGRPLSFPKVRWEKESLRDENAKVQLMTQLVEKNLIPESNLVRLLNIDPVTAAQKIDDEKFAKIQRYENMKKRLQASGIPLSPEIMQILGFQLPEQGEPVSKDLPISTGGEGGAPMPAMMPQAGLPDVVPGATPDNPTGGFEKQPGVQGAPPESSMPVGMAT